MKLFTLKQLLFVSICIIVLKTLKLLLDQISYRIIVSETGHEISAVHRRTKRDGVNRDWFQHRQLFTNASTPKKMLLFAYMRGGSTLLYKIFDQDPRAVAWYEPLAPLYGLLYGVPQCRNYKHIVFNEHFNSKSLTLRTLPDWEMEDVISYVNLLFSCNLYSLQTEVLSNNFLTHSNFFQQYLNCFRNNNKCKQSWEHFCLTKSGISDHCAQGHGDDSRSYVLRSQENYCPQLLKASKLHAESAVPYNALNNKTSQLLSKCHDYNQCIQCLQGHVETCIKKSDLLQKCQHTNIRVGKVLRLKMAYIEPILRAIPDLYLVFYTRDPRAISNSRIYDDGAFDLNMTSRSQMWTEQTLALCKEMSADVLELQRLEQKYPGAFLRLRYEDLIKDPSGTLHKLYGHISTDVSPSVETWLVATMQSKSREHRYGVQRRNATETAHKWRHNFPAATLSYVLQHPRCKDVLSELGYI